MSRKIEMDAGAAFALALEHQTAGGLDAAEAIYRDILAAVPEHAASLHFLGIVRFQAGYKEEGLKLVRQSVELRPRDAVFMQNLGGMLRELGQQNEALEQLRAAIARDADNYVALGNLCTLLHAAGDDAEAARYGQRALLAKDREACARFMAEHGQATLSCEPRPFQHADPERNVIAFSLWGADPIYIDGAVENALLARHLYPEWRCRFYVDTTITQTVIDALTRERAQVVQFKQPARGHEGLFWRFFVANDPGVDRFLCRDCDCRLNVRERVAVEEWIESGQAFHIMRDNVCHAELIPAGLWGGIAGVLPDIRSLSEAYLKTHGDRWADQHFLREEIWPLVRPVALTHDSHYQLANSKPFPRYGTLPPPAHVGGSFRAGGAAPYMTTAN